MNEAVGKTTPKQAMDLARESVRENLAEIAAELLAWHNTGFLPDGKLREIARSIEHLAMHDALSVAEHMAKYAALEALAHGR